MVRFLTLLCCAVSLVCSTPAVAPAKEPTLQALIKESCTLAGNVAVQAVDARAHGVHSSALISQLNTLESQHAIKMPGMLALHTEIVLYVYSKPTLTPQAARTFVEGFCTRVFTQEAGS
jgi:hypothetical protein